MSDHDSARLRSVPPLGEDTWVPPVTQRFVERLRRARRPVPFDRSWDLVRSGSAPPVPTNARPPAVLDSRMRLRAAYLAVPVLANLHALVPDVQVEGASVEISEHLDGDYWPDERLIRVECHHPVDVIAFTLLHEFGHAVDHLLLDDRDRASLGHEQGVVGWRERQLDWEGRGEEWFADSFAHWWWPGRMEPHRPTWRMTVPPLAAGIAGRAFDLGVLAQRRNRA